MSRELHNAKTKQQDGAGVSKGPKSSSQKLCQRKELQAFANRNGIDVFEDKLQIIRGWEGQPKGLLQVLWERGFVAEAMLEKYTLEGRKDAISGDINLQFSLRHLMSECTDFKEEETALHYL
jgi:hypothetical protein